MSQKSIIDVTISAFYFQAGDGIRNTSVTGVQTCALPISGATSGYQSGCLEVFGPSIDIDNNINMSELKLYDGDNDSDEKYLKDDLENEKKQLQRVRFLQPTLVLNC